MPFVICILSGICRTHLQQILSEPAWISAIANAVVAIVAVVGIQRSQRVVDQRASVEARVEELKRVKAAIVGYHGFLEFSRIQIVQKEVAVHDQKWQDVAAQHNSFLTLLEISYYIKEGVKKQLTELVGSWVSLSKKMYRWEGMSDQEEEAAAAAFRAFNVRYTQAKQILEKPVPQVTREL